MSLTSARITKTLQLYKPHEMQLAFHNSRVRYRVAALGRQAGKSTMCLNEILRKAWENPGTRYWFISPTYSQASKQYRRMVHILSSCPGVIDDNVSLRIRLINQSEIEFKSGQVFDNLRGDTLHGVVIDEVRDQHPDLWPMVIKPMLATTKGWAAFVSTPNGFDAFYDLWARAQVDHWWEGFQAPSTCNPMIGEAELEEAKRMMSEPKFAQEYLAEFRDITSGKAYFSFGTHNMRESNPFAVNGNPVSEWMPIHLYCDFNVFPISWTMHQFSHGYGHHQFDEIFIEDRSDTYEAALEFVERFKKLPKIRANPQVIICGDASGNSMKTSSVGSSDYDILKKVLKDNGISFDDVTPKSNPGVKDRVNTVNARLLAADKSVRFTLNPKKCPNTMKDFQRVVWKKGTSAILDQMKNPMLTHLSDSVGYGICVMDAIPNLTEVGSIRRVNL